MTEHKPETGAAELGRRALSRWDNEGGAIEHPSLHAAMADQPRMSDAELVHLRVRMIALENVVIALLSASSDRDDATIREMADTISPRAGFTPHPLTIEAARQMNHLVDRAAHFRLEASRPTLE